MKYLTQKLKLEYKLEEGHVISSEVEIKYDDDDDYMEELGKAKLHLVDTIANDRPNVQADCSRILGIEYSEDTLNRLKKEYELRRKLIIDFKEKNLQSENLFSRLFNSVTKLKQIEDILEFAGIFDEFSSLLYFLITNDEDKNIFELETELPHLPLNRVYPPEDDLSTENN